MNQRIGKIAQVITVENGKTLKESEGEIISAIKEMDFQINEGLRICGEVMPWNRMVSWPTASAGRWVWSE